MYFLIQVSQDAPNSTVNENFDHLIIPSDRVPDFQDIFLSQVIRQHLFNFNRKNIFSPDTFSVYEDTTFFSSAMCEGDYYSYSFSCYRYFDQPFEVVEFANSFVSDSFFQYMLHIHLQDVIDHFSSIPSYAVSALDIKELIEDFFCDYDLDNQSPQDSSMPTE